MIRRALITGITGQDGHHLTKFLLQRGYEVHGLVSSERDDRYQSFKLRFPNVELHPGDLGNFISLCNILDEIRPDEIYNLGALTFVGSSFEQPEITANVTGLGALRLLEAVRIVDKERLTRFYQASSSEMFGQVLSSPQNERTEFHPVSPYAISKVFAHHSAQMYRTAYDMHVSSGILFNHEGEFRGYEFVTRKITSNIARIALGRQSTFRLGSLSPQRDWGYAGDYVEAMWLMLQQDSPDDYVIATGECFSVYQFVESALKYAGLPGEVNDYVISDPDLFRPAEVQLLRGDASKAARVLGWRPKTNFEQLVELMVRNDLEIEARK